jgi:hypothetical protein
MQPNAKTQPLKEVSVAGTRSSNSFRQNLRRAKKKAKESKDKRKHKKNKTQKKKRTKIRLKHTSQTGGKHTSSKIPKKHKSKTKKRSILKSKYTNKTLKKSRNVRWRDEHGDSLTSFSDDHEHKHKTSFSDEPPLLTPEPLTSFRHTQKNNSNRFSDDDEIERNIVVKWKIDDDKSKKPTLDDITEDLNEGEPSNRLKEAGINTDRSAPKNLIEKLAILSYDLPNGSIQSIE